MAGGNKREEERESQRDRQGERKMEKEKNTRRYSGEGREDERRARETGMRRRMRQSEIGGDGERAC